MKKHWAMIAFAALLLGSLSLQLLGAWQDSPTRDEPSHMVDGLAYWQLGTFEFNYPHPPLAKIGSGLVLYAAGVRIDTQSDAWKNLDTEKVNAQVLYNDPDWRHVRWLTFIARLPMLIFWALLIALLWFASKKWFGTIPALVVTTIIAFDPSLLGHGHLVNTDVPMMAMTLATILTADWYFQTPTLRRLLGLAVVIALTLLTKFSAIYLLPILGLLMVWHIIRHRARYPRGVYWKWPLASLGIVVVAFVLCYQAEGLKPNRTTFPSWSISFGDTTFTPPIPSYWKGLYYNVRHNALGHRTIYKGRVIQDGTWSYFPTALLTKSPLPSLALTLATVIVTFWVLIRQRWRPSFRNALFVLPPALYLASAMMSHLNIGVRHVFPIIPFVALWVAWAASHVPRWARLGMLAIALTVIPITAIAYPHTIAYFNAAAGGTKNGARWFVDSNLDWGQDGWRVRQYIDAHPETDTSVSLFGSTPNALVANDALAVVNDRGIRKGVQPSHRVIISSGLLDAPDRGYVWIQSLSSNHIIDSIGSTVTVLRF